MIFNFPAAFIDLVRCIIDQEVDAPSRICRFSEERLDLSGLGYISLDREGGAAF